MKREDIIRMAIEAGDSWDDTLPSDKEFLGRFAALVAAAEREECARIAEERPTFTRYAEEVLEDVVKLIRARGDA